jgi:hypothetical protein
MQKRAGYMAAPERFAESQIPLAPRAPSIHGPSRHSRLVRETVAIGEQQTLTCTSAEWLSSV